MIEDKNPLVIKILKKGADPKIAGDGDELTENTYVQSFKVVNPGEQQPASYVEKPVPNLVTAQETWRIYQLMKKLGLPVVSFLKMKKERDPKTGRDNNSVIMQDLSDHGSNLVVSCGSSSGHEYPEHYSLEILQNVTNADEIREKMVKSLAVLHNNGIYEFHSKLSFVLVVDKTEVDNEKKIEAEFKILDYSNFANKTSPLTLLRSPYAGEDNEVIFADNLDNLVYGTCKSPNEKELMRKSYKQYREQEIKTYN